MKKVVYILVVTPYITLVIGGSLFLSAGRLNIPMFWLYLFIWLLTITIIALTVDPELLKERAKPGPGGQDHLMRVLTFPLLLSHFIIAGLDVGRFHWSDTVPFVWQVAGVLSMLIALGVVAWSYLVNPFFSSVIRVQEERNHHVITTGPYQYVRHPSYTAGLLLCVSSSLVLGSWLSYVPALAGIVLFIRRTVMEDRFLRSHLPGYVEYSQKVRHRLLPGVW